MATRANLIATYNSNPTLQSRYTLQQYLDLFGFGATQQLQHQQLQLQHQLQTTTGVPNIINQNLNQGGGGGGDGGQHIYKYCNRPTLNQIQQLN